MINDFRGEYRWLSNFYIVNVTYEGVLFPSVEHAYQAAKSLSPDIRLAFANPAVTPSQARRMGASLKDVRPDWFSANLSIMEELNSQKYSYPELKAALLATGDQELVEGNTWGDTFWGVCNGVGENHLGKILMKIRNSLTPE